MKCFWENIASATSSIFTRLLPAPCDFFLFPKLQIHLESKRFKDVEDIKRNITFYQKRSFRGALINGQLTGINVLNTKGSILI